MAYGSVPITPGSGISVAIDATLNPVVQIFKLDIGASGASKPVVQGGTDGLPVDILSGPGAVSYFTVKPKSGETFPISAASAIPIADNSGTLTVDAPVGTPVAVRLSDGSSFISGLPVSGTVTATQGTAASNSGAWPVKISDGTSAVGITDVAGSKAIKVDVIQSVALAGGLADLGTFTAGTTAMSTTGGLYNDSATAPSSGQAAAFRINAARGLHVNLRKADGTDLGTSGDPVRTDPVGTTAQPVKLKDSSGNAYTDANPLPIQISSNGRTRVTKLVSMTASQTGVTMWTPSGSNFFYVEKIVLAITVTGTLTLFGGTNSEPNTVIDGTQATGNREYNFNANPWKATAGGDLLKYTSGTGLVGVAVIHGFESAT